MLRPRGVAAVAGAVIAALSFSACTNNDADAGDVADALTDADVPQDQADCIGEAFEAEFDQEQMNDLAAADSPEEWPSGSEETVDSIIDECIDGAGSEGQPGDESQGEGEGGPETTTTTAAGG